MAVLKAVIAKLDDVEEAFRGLYVQKGDKFEIQVDGLKTQADIDRVLAATTKEREDHAKTKVSLKEATDTLAAFGELKPDEVNTKLEKLATLEGANTPELTKNFETIVNGRVEATLANRVKTETAKLTKTIGELSAQVATFTSENEGFKTQITQRTIDDAVRNAATTAKLLPAAVADALIHARGTFIVEADGKVQTKDGIDPAAWLDSKKEVAAHWWPVARGAGAHGGDGLPGGKENPWNAASWNMTKQSEIVRADPANAAKLAEAAGVTVGATRPAAKAA